MCISKRDQHKQAPGRNHIHTIFTSQLSSFHKQKTIEIQVLKSCETLGSGISFYETQLANISETNKTHFPYVFLLFLLPQIGLALPSLITRSKMENVAVLFVLLERCCTCNIHSCKVTVKQLNETPVLPAVITSEIPQKCSLAIGKIKKVSSTLINTKEL